MTLDKARVHEIFLIFSKVLPIYKPETKKALEAHFNVKLENVIPALCVMMSRECTQNKNIDNAERFFEFMVHAILYAKGEIDEPPYYAIETKEELTFRTKKLKVILD